MPLFACLVIVDCGTSTGIRHGALPVSGFSIIIDI